MCFSIIDVRKLDCKLTIKNLDSWQFYRFIVFGHKWSKRCLILWQKVLGSEFPTDERVLWCQEEHKSVQQGGGGGACLACNWVQATSHSLKIESSISRAIPGPWLTRWPTFKIQLDAMGKQTLVHHDKLKPYEGSMLHHGWMKH